MLSNFSYQASNLERMNVEPCIKQLWRSRKSAQAAVNETCERRLLPQDSYRISGSERGSFRYLQHHRPL